MESHYITASLGFLQSWHFYAMIRDNEAICRHKQSFACLAHAFNLVVWLKLVISSSPSCTAFDDHAVLQCYLAA